jgi:predicted dehydrogenase
MKVGLIGIRGHASRIKKLLSKRKDLTLKVIYLHRPDNDPLTTEHFEDLFCCDGIFLASPTPCHAEQLKKLENYKGHIFCEKPIAPNLDTREWITQKFRHRFYVNYSFHCSPIGLLISQLIHEGSLGELIDFRLSFGNPHLHRCRTEDWRENALGGPTNTIISHLLHFLMTIDRNVKFMRPKETSALNSYMDTSKVESEMKGATGYLLTTWASPVFAEIKFLFTKANLCWDGNKFLKIELNDSLETVPTEVLEINPGDNFMRSLENSLDIFVEGIRKGAQRKDLFEVSLAIEEYLFNNFEEISE